jgi:DNA-binding SARP family transcriptional activator
MERQVDVRVLGDLELKVAEEPVKLGGPVQRIVLGMLLVNFQKVVSVDNLIGAMWAERPPNTAVATLQAYISRLRKMLGPAAFRLQAVPNGYRLDLERSDLDAERFREAVQEAQDLSTRPAQVVRLLEPALSLWRSAEVLGSLGDQPWAVQFKEELKDQRRLALELLAEAHLKLGHAQSAVAGLDAAVTADPHDETAVRLLMLALYRSGRQAEALAAFDSCRRRLDDDLGLTPSPALRSMQRSILQQDPELDWRAGGRRVPPRLLPPRNRQFSGRERELSTLKELLLSAPLVTLYGLGGSGKSAIALEFAHLRPGLSWWIPAEDTASIAAALVELAARLDIDTAVEEAVMLNELWSLLAEREDWLLIFDNAEDPESVADLIPPSINGRILITSQNPAWSSLGRTLRVDPFALDDATRFVLARSNRREPAAARALAAELDSVALALVQACAYIDQTGMSIAEYHRLFLFRHHQLLGRGAPADHRATVSTTWQLVFDRVRSRSTLAALILEMSAFLSPDGIPLYLFDPLVSSGSSVIFADAVAELLRYSLVDRTDHLLSLHRLVQTVVQDQLSEDERSSHLHAAVDLVVEAAPEEGTVPESWPRWSALAPQVHALLRAAELTGTVPPRLVVLTLTCNRYYRARGSLLSAHELLDTAIEVVKPQPHQRHILAELYAEMGNVLDAEGRLVEAQTELERAVATFSAAPGADSLVAARTWAQLAHVLNCGDSPAESVHYYEQALEVLRARGETTEVIRTLIGFGYARWGLNDFIGGEECFTEALSLLQELDWTLHPFVAEAMSGLGMMLHEQGRLEEAKRLQLEALDVLNLLHGSADHPTKAEIHDKLCYETRRMEDYSGACEHGQQAVAMLTRLFGDRDPRLAMALTNLGLAEATLGDLGSAEATQRRAFDILTATYGPSHRNTLLVSGRLDELLSTGAPVATATSIT